MRQLQKSGRVLIESLENRSLMSASPAGIIIDPPVSVLTPTQLVIGTPTVHAVIFTASNGRTTLIHSLGATATLTFAGVDVPKISNHLAVFPANDVETLDTIVMTNATPGKAALNIVHSGLGRGTFEIGSITGGDIGSINAPDVVLTGDVAVTSVRKITIAGVSGATLSLGSYATAIKISGNFTGSLSAQGLASLTAQSFLAANITTTGAFTAGKNQIGTITVAKGIVDSNIIASGNVGSVSAGYINQSVITAGTVATATGSYPSVLVPESYSDFTAAAIIRSLRVSTGKIGVYEEGFVGDSVIAAYSLGTLQLGELTSSGGGVAAHSFSSIAAVSPSGGLDRIKIKLSKAQLSSVAKLRDALTVPYTSGLAGPDNTAIYNFDINVLG